MSCHLGWPHIRSQQDHLLLTTQAPSTSDSLTTTSLAETVFCRPFFNHNTKRNYLLNTPFYHDRIFILSTWPRKVTIPGKRNLQVRCSLPRTTQEILFPDRAQLNAANSEFQLPPSTLSLTAAVSHHLHRSSCFSIVPAPDNRLTPDQADVQLGLPQSRSRDKISQLDTGTMAST